MKHQYYHANNQYSEWQQSFTAVCVVPEKKFLLEMISLAFNHKDIVLPMYFGYTMVHKNDQYCKRTGREKSKNRVLYQKFTLHRLEFFLDYTYIYLINDSGNTITLEIKAGRDRVYFTGVQL